MKNILAKLMPFVFLGIMIVLFVVGMIVFSYLLIVGALVGVVLFIIAWLKQAFFSSKNLVKREDERKGGGRTIDHK